MVFLAEHWETWLIFLLLFPSQTIYRTPHFLPTTTEKRDLFESHSWPREGFNFFRGRTLHLWQLQLSRVTTMVQFYTFGAYYQWGLDPLFWRPTPTPLISRSRSGTGRTSNGLSKSPPQQYTNFSEFLFYHQRNCWKLPFPFYWLTLLIPNIHIQILKTEIHTFLYNLTEFIKRSKHFLFGDHFFDSHNLSLLNIVRRKLMMATFCKLECIWLSAPLKRYCFSTDVLKIKNVLRVEKQNYNGQFFNNNFDHCEQEFSFLRLCMYNF